jgi:hypothetical protein
VATCGHPEYESYDHGCENYDPATTWVFDDDPGADDAAPVAADDGEPAADDGDDLVETNGCVTTLMGYDCVVGFCAVDGDYTKTSPLYEMTNTVYGCATACDDEAECTGFDFDGTTCVLATAGLDGGSGEAAWCYVNARAARVAEDESSRARRPGPPWPALLGALLFF